MSWTSWEGLIATCLGCGKLSPAPGTWGSLAALPLAALPIWLAGAWGLVTALLIVILVGTLAAGRYAQAAGLKDPSEVVVDEVAGQWIALLPILFAGRAQEWLLWALAFLLFRGFDIAKPWPCRPLERLPGGLGIMADDLAAGLYAALILTAVIWGLGTSHV